MDELIRDKRFAHVPRDPQYKRIPRTERKVQIDKRFQSMFKDKRFQVQYIIDKRGRPVNQTSSENLKKYYNLPTSEEEEEEEKVEKPKELKKTKSKKLKKKKVKAQDEESSDNCLSSNGELLRIKPKEESDSDSNVDSADSESLEADLKESKKQLKIRRQHESDNLTSSVKNKLRDLSVNYARGEGVLLTDSSSDEESSDTLDEEEEIEHNWGELDKEAETTDEITRRLAVCNMDWDRVRAIDLMVLFHSFLPSGGVIHSVTIYPSEFGLERMKEEEVSGPKELINNKEATVEDDDNEEGSQYHMEKLRQYQLNRLKYYYAVVEFDSAETANKVYTECDGTEYESTSTRLDLRFIPEDMEFDQTPKEVCDKVPEPSKYQPRQFTTTALQQVKVELTWDETNPERVALTQKLNSGKLEDVNKNDLQAYLATDSSDSDSEEKRQEATSESETETNVDPVERYKALLKEIEQKEEEKEKKDVELEFTWGLDAEEKAEKLVQERLKKDEKLTPFEQYLEKRKMKKKAKREERKKDVENEHSSDDEARKAELELLLMDDNDDGKRHFNMKKIEENANMSKSKKKRLGKKKDAPEMEDNFEVNVQDPRFGALFTSHHFNIDPADPHYKRTKGTEALVKEKLKRRIGSDSNEIEAKVPKK